MTWFGGWFGEGEGGGEGEVVVGEAVTISVVAEGGDHCRVTDRPGGGIMSATTIDLSSATTLNLRLRAATGAALVVTVKRGGAAVNLAGAAIKYVANLATPITKEVGTGITITDAAGGVFRLAFTEADTATQNYNQQGEHECKLLGPGGGPEMVWEGTLSLEQTLITDIS